MAAAHRQERPVARVDFGEDCADAAGPIVYGRANGEGAWPRTAEFARRIVRKKS